MHQQRIEGWVKRNDRSDVNLSATAHRKDGSAVAVRITNLSFDGCQMETEQALQVGERITVALRGLGEVIAQIRWVVPTGCTAGAHFLLEEAEAEKRGKRFGI